MKPWIVPLSLAILLSACSSNSTTTVDNVANPAQTEKTKDVDLNAQKKASVEGFVNTNAENLANFAMKFVKSDDLSKEIQNLVTVPENAGSKKNAKNNGPVDNSSRSFLYPIYEARGFSPIFVSGSAISPAASPLVAEFERFPAHGLAKVNTSTWNDARTGLAEAGNDVDNGKFEFTDEEKSQIVNLIIEKNVDYSDPQAVKKFMTELVKSETMMPRLHNTVAGRISKMANSAKQTALLEVSTAELAYKFALEMGSNFTHLTDEETEMLGKKPTDAKYKEIGNLRARRWFDSLVRVMDSPAAKAQNQQENAADDGENNEVAEVAEGTEEPVIDEAKDAHAAETAAANAQHRKIDEAQDVATLVNALYPPHPAYKQLMDARDRYVALADWENVSEMLLKKGKSHKNMPALRKRLQAEGYFDGDVNGSDVYDDDTRAAVRFYHETHQLDYDEVKGIQKSFWESLNTPRSKRIEQIDENLRRWHNTQIIDSPYYIFVNVPDFHGEVWRNGERVYRFPVVTGNAKRACDPQTKQWKFINATPLMHARMLYIEYNPYWIVPPRIEQEEYISKINADPNWLKDHNFEYYTQGGHTVLRQLPGEKNALGRVKFIFPNPHSTFLHDSPQKGLFKYPIRAFSHGCMRVWQPLELAKRLLEYDGQWNKRIPKEIDEKMEEPRRFMLKNRFDVFIDYFNVRVGDDGVVYFLADPYKYVRYALEPPSAKEISCTPKTTAKKAAPAGGQSGVGADAPE